MLINSVLVTGANRGLGLEFVKHFLKLTPPPKHIIAVCRDPEKSPDLKKLAQDNSSITILALEVTDTAQYDKAVASVRKIVGSAGLNVLVNNAGIFDMSKNHLNDLTKENMAQHMDINLYTPVLLTKAFFPLLKEASDARKTGEVSAAVVNISALLGCVPFAGHFPGGFPYKFSKAGLNMATHCLASDLQPTGILVVAIHPGWVQTDMGGPNGDLTPNESITGCVKIITGLNETHNGKLFNVNGDIMPM